MKRVVWFAIFWLVFWAVASFVAPFLFKTYSQDIRIAEALRGPSLSHWFGTDSLGRDLLARLLCGGSISLGISFAAVFFSLFIGTWIGAVAGYFGGWTDRVLMSVVDVMLCFPFFFLILAVVAVLGPSAWNILWILALTSWMGTSRLVRAEVLSLKEREYVMASKALGAGELWILRNHLIPNALEPVAVSAIFGMSGAILAEGGLSFLGVGVQPPTPSWGNLLMDGKATLGVAWWMTFFPGLVIFLTVMSLNVIGDALTRDKKIHS
jgi:peptide/nickel transport system permease protein